MNIAVIGSGGREHALCRKIHESKISKNIICIPGNAGTSNILARAPSIRRRMGEAQRSKSPAPQQRDNPNYDERGQNEVDRGWVNVATQEDDELGHIPDPNIGKRKWYDPRGWVGMGGKRRRRRRTRGRRRSRRRRRRRTRKRHRRRRRR